MKEVWVQSIRVQQCEGDGTPFFFKQSGCREEQGSAVSELAYVRCPSKKSAVARVRSADAG